MVEHSGDFVEGRPSLYVQGLFEQSSTKKHRLGTIRALEDGRVFAYARAGAALAAGEATQAAAIDAYSTEVAVQAAVVVGDKYIYITYGGGATAIADYYLDGFIGSVMPAQGIGATYKIRGHLAMTSGATVKVNLYDAVRVALTTSSKCTLVKHPQDNVIQSIITTPTAVGTGVPPIAVTNAYYFWNQVKGVAQVLVNGTWVIGDALSPGGVAGALMPQAAVTDPIWAYCVRVGTNARGGMVVLAIPGY